MDNSFEQELSLISNKTNVCHLCGEIIHRNPADPLERLAKEHVPPKQFFPKEIRNSENLNLKLAPAHRRCNEDYRKDEEYFYHCLWPLVQQTNAPMGSLIFRDLARRMHKPQSPAMIRRLLTTVSNETPGGLHLPPGLVRFNVNEHRIQRIALKIARGLLYMETTIYMPLENAKDIRLCSKEDEVPEFYQITWQATEIKGAYPKVFSYRYFEADDLHCLMMLFWGAFMFCVTFDDPQEKPNAV